MNPAGMEGWEESAVGNKVRAGCVGGGVCKADKSNALGELVCQPHTD